MSENTKIASLADFNNIGFSIGMPVWLAVYPNLLVQAYIESKSYVLSIDDEQVWYYSWQNDAVRDALLKRISGAKTHAVNKVLYDTDIPLGHSVPLDDDGWDRVYLSTEAARAAFKQNIYPNAGRRQLMRFHKKLPALVRQRMGVPQNPGEGVFMEQWLSNLDLANRKIIRLR